MVPELLNLSYDELRDDHAKAVAYRRSRNGSVEIPITAGEFEGWLKEHRTAAHMELLWVFAEDKAARLSRPFADHDQDPMD